jgi:hypothetical protein
VLPDKVFISHSHQDTALYSRLCKLLDDEKIVRFDVREMVAGDSLAGQLRAAIEECHTCVFLATEHSLKSEWCRAELGAFWGAGKNVVIYSETNQIQENQLPPQFTGNLFTNDLGQLINGIRRGIRHPVKRTANGFAVTLGSMTVRVTIGRIEELAPYNDWLIALPANEYFDDACIDDRCSALGAFIQHHFPDNIELLKTELSRKLRTEKTTKVMKRPGISGKSFGTGKCLFLDPNAWNDMKIAMVSVTTDRADEGLRGRDLFVFQALAAINSVMANNRLSKLRVPILASGHGGMRRDVALMCMLIALGELERTNVSRIRVAELVVFSGDTEGDPPLISHQAICRRLEFAAQLFGTNAGT